MLFFKKKPLLDVETSTWLLELLGWAIESLGGIEQLEKTPLVLPTDTFFPPQQDTGDAKARRMFERVKDLADMADWPCRLEPLPERAPHEVGTGLGQIFDKAGAAGTFSVSGDEKPEVVIQYDPRLITQPIALIAMFAHELGHYLMATAKNPGPNEAELHEQATDALAVYMGFGVFLADSAFETEAWSDSVSMGHGYVRQGYLTENELAYALAVFMRVKRIELEDVAPHLKKRICASLSHALRDLAAIDCVQEAAQTAWKLHKKEHPI